MTATRSRTKKEYRFALYPDVLEDSHLMAYVDYLRKTQQLPQVIRNALRLVWTLGEGDLSVLFELFPSLRGQFMPKPDELIEQFRQMLYQRMMAAMSVAPEPPPAGPQQLELPLDLEPREPTPPPAHPNESMEQTIQEAVQAGIQQVLNELSKMQTQTVAVVTDHQTNYTPQKGSAKPLTVPQLAMPTFDDNDEDELVIQQDTSAGTSTTSNFLDAAFDFQQRKDD
jgi:hypothetical protein